MRAKPYADGVVRLTPKDDADGKAARALSYMATNPKNDEQWVPMEKFWSSLIEPHTYVISTADQWQDLTTRGSPPKFGGALGRPSASWSAPTAFA